MCGLLFFKDKLQEEILEEPNMIAHRGPDQYRVMQEEWGTFGFHRLAIMDVKESGMQPFDTTTLRLVCNGEIYNEPALRKRYSTYPYQGHSDCEILLPLYLDKGMTMCEELDAEFAFVLYDKINQRLVAGRDPIGIRPLFYGYSKQTGSIAFASEMKALQSFCNQITPFPIGHIYWDGVFVPYYDLNQTDAIIDCQDTALLRIHDLLIDGVKKRMVSDVPIGYLLSGGLDSSLVCSIAARHSDTPLETFAIGMATDAIDLKYARQVAAHIGSNHHEVIMTVDDVLAVVQSVIYHLESYDITTIRASIGMFVLSRYIKKNSNVKVLLTGEISDELFGYKYTDFAPSAEQFQKEAEKRLNELYLYDVLRADRCIAAWSLEARVPFGDLAFVKAVMAIDPQLKMNTTGTGKYLLRKAFDRDDYLPHAILWREKAAFSDAVGHSMVDKLKQHAERLYRDEDLKTAAMRYPHCPPHTKEALWYRDIFESFYPSQSHVIPRFWMPNPDWVGSSITDPSARYLSNYNKSGT